MRDAVITKPDRLTPDEYAEIKKHPEIGAKILEPVSFLSDIVACVRHHPEWFDGSASGYPERLRGDQIPLPSRIILVADTVEAMGQLIGPACASGAFEKSTRTVEPVAKDVVARNSTALAISSG